jgi:hypothetical protein
VTRAPNIWRGVGTPPDSTHELQGVRRMLPPARSPMHDLLPACAVCKAPAGEPCIAADGRTMPGTAVHRVRVTARVTP